MSLFYCILLRCSTYFCKICMKLPKVLLDFNHNRWETLRDLQTNCVKGVQESKQNLVWFETTGPVKISMKSSRCLCPMPPMSESRKLRKRRISISETSNRNLMTIYFFFTPFIDFQSVQIRAIRKYIFLNYTLLIEGILVLSIRL